MHLLLKVGNIDHLMVAESANHKCEDPWVLLDIIEGRVKPSTTPDLLGSFRHEVTVWLPLLGRLLSYVGVKGRV